MVASKVAWVTVLAGVFVALGIAVSASGMMPGLTSHPGPSTPAAGGWGNNSSRSWTSYAVTFTETGLPNGTFWWVGIHGPWGHWFVPAPPGPGAQPQDFGLGWNGSTSSSVGFSLPNGTYAYQIGSAHANGTLYGASPVSGTISVNGTNVSTAVTFAAATFYAVTFTESGLPNGTFWSVHVQGAGWGGSWGPSARTPSANPGSWNGSTNGSIGFQLPDGTYPYFVPPAWSSNGTYLASPEFGTLTVNGSAMTVSVSFSIPVAYEITFNESGLPVGTNWSVVLFGGNWWNFGYNSSANSSIGFARTDGTYRYAVPDVWTSGGLYLANPAKGSLAVNGTNVSLSVTFAPLSFYNVTFVESGLPSGTNWSAALFTHLPGGSTWGVSNSTSLTLSSPNGTFDFLVGPVWNATGIFTASPSYGNVTVNGTSVVVSVSYAFTNYSSGWGPSRGTPMIRDAETGAVMVPKAVV